MLNERAAAVLNVLVGEYLQSATPVASDDIARSLGHKISSATVRNTMARLNDDGYISRPHVSSGGVPSDLGYRYYVESLPETPRLPTELREIVDRDLTFAEYWTDTDQIEQFKKKSAKCAEVLVPERINPQSIMGVYVSCREAKEIFDGLGTGIDVTINSHMFFR